MQNKILTQTNINVCFEGCSECGAKCCSSNLIFLSLYDIENVAKFFPIFFRIKDNQISLIFFFYNKTNDYEDKKCIYLKDNLCSIYNNRPYACMSFPFAFGMEDGEFSYSDECPYITKFENKPNSFKLIEENKLNPKIIENFISYNFIHYAKDIQKDTQDFINFCVNNNILVKFEDSFKDEKYKNFQPNYLGELYTINKIKISILNLKRKDLFENNNHIEYIKYIMYSEQNMDKML